MARRRRGGPRRCLPPLGALLAAVVLLTVACGIRGSAAAARQRRQHVKTPTPIPTPEPKVCVCQNASQPLDLDSVRYAVAKAQARSHLLSFHIAWEDLEVRSAAKGAGGAAPAQPEGEADPANKLGSCTTAQHELAASPEQVQLVGCLNDNFTPRGVTWAGAMQEDASGTLKVVGTWWTSYPADVTMTLVTTATSDRLAQLEAQCRTWPGPLSVALFQGLVQEDGGLGPLTPENIAILRQAVVQISNFVAEMATTPGFCQPDVMLTYEVYADETAKVLFPVNMLRNYARLQARTPTLALVDVDLVVSKSISQRIYNAKKASALRSQTMEKTVFIIPAFDVVGEFEVPAWADALVSSSKETMVHAFDRDWVMAFHSARFPVGHRLTNFSRWRVAKADYAVKYELMCEPWLIGDRLLMPFHDARFRGFGLNKIQHIASLNAEDFKFKVLADVFAVHRPHKYAVGRSVWHTRGTTMPGLPSLRAHNYALFQDQQSLMSTGSFKPVVSPAVEFCRSALPWWSNPALDEPPRQEDMGTGTEAADGGGDTDGAAVAPEDVAERR